MVLETEKIKVYAIPGLGASKHIFDHLNLGDRIDFEPLEQLIPQHKESFEHYIQRWNKMIIEPNSIIIGVSFGGIIAQEIALLQQIRKLVLISSVSSEKQFPFVLKLFKYKSFRTFIMTKQLARFDQLEHNPKNIKEERFASLLKKYLPFREVSYILWSIDNIAHWKKKPIQTPIIEIHGTKDELFPASKKKNAILVKNGTHGMIVFKYNWFNENLPKLLNTF